MRCELSPQAEIVLREIGDSIARDNPQRAASFVGELLAHSQRIAEQPKAYPPPARVERGAALLRSRALRDLLLGQSRAGEGCGRFAVVHGDGE